MNEVGYGVMGPRTGSVYENPISCFDFLQCFCAALWLSCGGWGKAARKGAPFIAHGVVEHRLIFTYVDEKKEPAVNCGDLFSAEGEGPFPAIVMYFGGGGKWEPCFVSSAGSR